MIRNGKDMASIVLNGQMQRDLDLQPSQPQPQIGTVFSSQNDAESV
jgi:hypothetical protein